MLQFKSDLKIGDDCPEVAGLKVRLMGLGFNRVYLDGKVRILDENSTYFGEVTQECLESFQAKVVDAMTSVFIPAEIREQYPFTVDGVMNYADWYLLNNYEKLAEYYKKIVIPDPIQEPVIDPDPAANKSKQLLMLEKVIEIARTQIGVVESAGYNNTGKEVNEYLKLGSCGTMKNGGAPWCAGFVDWLVNKACEFYNLKYPFPCPFLYTPDQVNWGKKKKITIINPKASEIDAGDFFFIYSASRNNARHVGIVEKVKSSTIVTIEGNTNNNGSAEGFGVFRRERTLPWAIVKWSKLF